MENNNGNWKWTFEDNNQGKIVLYKQRLLDGGLREIVDKGSENQCLDYDTNSQEDRNKIRQLAAEIVESRNNLLQS